MKLPLEVKELFSVLQIRLCAADMQQYAAIQKILFKVFQGFHLLQITPLQSFMKLALLMKDLYSMLQIVLVCCKSAANATA